MSQEHRNLTSREKRQYGRDEFYKWVETIGFQVKDNPKGGKTLLGIKHKYEGDDEYEEEKPKIIIKKHNGLDDGIEEGKNELNNYGFVV
jgi:hypothetical protein